ncbi:MAG TPA: hypothetical protein VG965_00660 [Patescibacteria group bacterium]|nr:hypothetical protein [Patescibacteria group bacterium]
MTEADPTYQGHATEAIKQTGQTDAFVATLDSDNPHREPLLNDDVAGRIGKALGRTPRKTQYPTSTGLETHWLIDLKPRSELYTLFIDLSSHGEDPHSVLDSRAYDQVDFSSNPNRRGQKGYSRSLGNIRRITSLEIDGNKVTFIQDAEGWRAQFSIDASGQTESSVITRGPITNRGNERVSFNFTNQGGIY